MTENDSATAASSPGLTACNWHILVSGAFRKIFQLSNTVDAGDTVSLEMTALDGSPTYAVQLKRLETGGQLNSQDNKLVWTEANGDDNDWWEWSDPPHFTKSAGDNGNSGIPWTDTPMTYVFDLTLDPTTPEDVYDLEFAVATGSLAYQDEHFYLNVIPEPSVAALSGLGLVGLLAWRRRRNR